MRPYLDSFVVLHLRFSRIDYHVNHKLKPRVSNGILIMEADKWQVEVDAGWVVFDSFHILI